MQHNHCGGFAVGPHWIWYFNMHRCMPSFTNTHTDNHMFAILHMRHLLWNQRRSYGTSQSTRESRFAAIAQIKWDDSSWHKFQARSCKRCGKSKTSRRQILRRKWSKENTRGSVKCDEWRHCDICWKGKGINIISETWGGHFFGAEPPSLERYWP